MYTVKLNANSREVKMYCERCLSMTSIAAGVQSLFSETVYQPYSMNDIFQSANKLIIWNDIYTWGLWNSCFIKMLV